MNKRGLSTVITTLIFILLALVVIGILWIVVKNIIEEDSATAGVKASMLYERVDISGVYIDPSTSNLTISIKKLSGKFVLNSSELVTSPVSTPMDVDVVTVNDFSGSMTCSKLVGDQCWLTPNNCQTCGGEWMAPFNSLKSANIQLVNSLIITGDNTKKIGLILYGDTAILSKSLNLTNNATKLNNTIGGWNNPSAPYQSTCICCGINSASQMLQNLSSPDRKKVMIIMSDGEAKLACGGGDPKDKAIAAACTANSTLSNLTIYSIGLGDSVDNSTLINISKCGNGSYYETDISGIASFYETIAAEINTMTETYTTIQKISGLRLVVYNNSQSVIINIPGNEVPNVLQTKKYIYNLENLGLTGEITRVEVYPLALTSKNKEITGSMLDFWVKK